MKDLSPICLFVFNRPHHTQTTLDALALNEFAQDSDLIIYADGARASRGDEPSSDAVRKIIRSEKRFKTVTVIESSTNKGLAQSITEGVSGVIQKFGKVIVLEDDLITSPYFLRFMNEALQKYNDVEKVISISGYMYPVATNLTDTFFMDRTCSWGWATWDRGWKHFNADSKVLKDEIENRNLKSDFNFSDSTFYFEMLEDQIAGKNNSWAIRFMAATYLKGLLTLYPRQTLVQNIGFDNTGTHCNYTTEYDGPMAKNLPLRFTDDIKSDQSAVLAMSKFFRKNRRFDQRVIRKIKKILFCLN